MNYISRNLEFDEWVRGRARYHWWVNLRMAKLARIARLADVGA